MKITAQDVFTILYEAFHKLESIKGPDEPEIDDKAQVDVYNSRLAVAQKEIESILIQGAQTLERYVDSRIKKTIAKMKYDGELK